MAAAQRRVKEYQDKSSREENETKEVEPGGRTDGCASRRHNNVKFKQQRRGTSIKFKQHQVQAALAAQQEHAALEKDVDRTRRTARGRQKVNTRRTQNVKAESG